MANDVRLKLGIDTSEVEKSFAALIRKIQGDADKLKLGPTSGKLAPGIESVRDAAQTSRNLGQRVREEKAGLEIINRELAKKKALIDEIAKRQENAIKGSREELALIQQRTRAEERLQQTQKIAQIQKVNFDKAQEGLNRAMGAQTGGGGGGKAGAGIPLGIGAPTSILAGIYAAVKAGSAVEGVRRFFAESQLRANVSEASAFQVQGQGGQRLQSLLNGGAPEELTFNPQRLQAAQMSQDAINARYATGGQGSLYTEVAKMIMGNEGAGALQHGNVVQAFRAMSGRFGNVGNQRLFESTKQQEQADEQQRQFEALKNGPEGILRTAVANRYLGNYQRDLDFQRQMGLGPESFRGRFQSPTGQFVGGFLGNVQSAGFTGEQGMGMAGGIMGAGGSTRSAVGNAALGLQAQRNLDVTNAGSILGKLSGGLGGADVTKEAFVKLLAEGTRVGLDGSEFREESRKFVETAADAISQSGTRTSGGVDQILSQFGRFFGDKTGLGIEAGKNAYELYRQTSMATTGPRGTMRAAGMLTDPMIRKLDRDSREALFNMPIDQLTSDNPAIMAMAKQANVSPQQLIDAQNRITSRSANMFARSDIATKTLAAVKKKYGRQSAFDMTGPFAPGEQEEIMAALGQANIAQIKEHPELGQNQRLASAYSDALASGDAQRQNKILEDAKKQQLEVRTTARPEDETNRIQAEASRMANQLFMSIRDSIVPASDAAKNFARDIDALTATMRAGTSGQISTAIKNFQTNYPGAVPTNQPSAGSPANGPGQ